jgi:hypothetical protein
MDMSGDIRVKTEEKYRDIYNDLKNFVVGDFHELFFICVCLGYKAKMKKPLGARGEDRFWSRTITPDEYACYYAMILEENNLDLASIRDDKVVMREIEKYANAGMEILLNDFLKEYCNKDLKLDHVFSKELPKTFLNHIFEQI